MITRLLIENYALIHRLNVDFSNGLSIITGETGAGKSILIGALSLILGERAYSSVITDKSKKCIAEAVFDIGAYDLAEFFAKHDLDWDTNTILRRELTSSGKSRSFINDTPVSLSQLKELGEHLVDIHSQHQKLFLKKSSFQLSILDAFAGNKELSLKFKELFLKTSLIEIEINKLREIEKHAKADEDYWRFQVEELENSGLMDENIEELKGESKMMEYSEDIKASLSEAISLLNRGDMGIVDQLSKCKTLLDKLYDMHAEAPSLINRLSILNIELKDIAGDIESIYEGIQYDPESVKLINDKLDSFSRLFHKHQVSSVEDLLVIKASLEEKIRSLDSLDDQIQHLETEKHNLKSNLKKFSDELSKKRHGVGGVIEKEIKLLLGKMGMPHADFKIQINSSDHITQQGADNVSFLFKANKGSQLCSLTKVASGGELSRLMLALKASVSKFMALPTIVFDEIDSGISGEIANKVGVIMDEMAMGMQVITITHLPQIAAKGAFHYLAYKDFDGDKTYSSLKKLDGKSRVNEIAKMLSGKTLSNAAIDNARELLQPH